MKKIIYIIAVFCVLFLSNQASAQGFTTGYLLGGGSRGGGGAIKPIVNDKTFIPPGCAALKTYKEFVVCRNKYHDGLPASLRWVPVPYIYIDGRMNESELDCLRPDIHQIAIPKGLFSKYHNNWMQAKIDNICEETQNYIYGEWQYLEEHRSK